MTLRLLVADDNVAVHKMVQLAFAREDAVIEAVLGGEAALDILHEFRPDVALADASMPGFSGYKVCELIRRDSEFAAIPVILLNGAFDPFDAEEAARVKASDHLTKPLDPSEMIAMVEKLLLESARCQAPDSFGNKAGEADAETEIAAGISAAAAESAAPEDAVSAKLPAAESRELHAESGATGGFFHVSPRALESWLGPDCILEILKATSENPKLCVTLHRQNAHLPLVNSAFASGASLDSGVFGGCLNDETFDRKTAVDWRIPDELIDRVAERVSEKMFRGIENRPVNLNEISGQIGAKGGDD
jgi:CheY-like chemotaxis protein